MNGPCFVDTNILSISRDPSDASKRDIAVALLDAKNIALSIQVSLGDQGDTRTVLSGRGDCSQAADEVATSYDCARSLSIN